NEDLAGAVTHSQRPTGNVLRVGRRDVNAATDRDVRHRNRYASLGNVDRPVFQRIRSAATALNAPHAGPVSNRAGNRRWSARDPPRLDLVVLIVWCTGAQRTLLLTRPGSVGG